MTTTPLISVILPAYNAEKYVKDAIESILNQTYTNFELLLINDGSKDQTLQTVQSIKDDRIKVINNEQNKGLVDSLNIGLNAAKGDFFARMDADDIALPNRFEEQINYLIKNTDIDIVSSNYEFFGTDSGLHKLPLDSETIAITLHYQNALCHPCTMMRAENIRKYNLHYEKPHLYTEDWVLWFNCLKKGLKFANLDKTLLKYRLEGQNNTTIHRETFEKRTKLVLEIIQQKMFGNYDEKSLDLHWNVSSGAIKNTNVNELTDFYNLFESNLIQAGYSKQKVKTLLNEKKMRPYCKFCDKSFRSGLKFMFKNKLFTTEHFKYLFASLKSKKN